MSSIKIYYCDICNKPFNKENVAIAYDCKCVCKRGIYLADKDICEKCLMKILYPKESD